MKWRSKKLENETDGYDPPSGRLHTCDGCGKQGVWQKPWQWYGSWKDLDDDKPVYKACSPECMARRIEVQECARIAADIEAAKSDEQRLEEELLKRRRWREQVEAKLTERQT